MYGVLQAIYGPVGDRLGKYKVIAVATALAAIGTAACALMPSLATLTLMRCLAGAASAAIIPLSMAWVGDVVPYQQRQGVLAKFLTGQITGLIFGQVAGGIIGEQWGWRVMFVVLAVVHIAASVALMMELRTNPATRSQTATGTLRGLNLPAILKAFAPVFARPWARICLLTVFFEGMAFFGSFVFIGADLHQRFGLGLTTVGLMIAAFGGGGVIYAWSAKTLVERFGERGLAGAGGLVLAGAFLLLALLPVAWLAPPVILLLGIGFYMLHNTLQTNATQMAPDARGVAVSLFASVFFFGQAIGVGLAGLVVDHWSARPVYVISGAALLALGLWFRNQLKWRA